MRKIIYSVLALVAMVLSMVSCTHDDVLTEGVQVTFTAELPESASPRSATSFASFGTGEHVTTLYCAIYEKTGETYRYVKNDSVKRNGDGFTFSPYLTKDKTYKIAFWAMAENAYEKTSDLSNITIPSEMYCNDPTKEAFAGVSPDVTVGETYGSRINVPLKRPFALLNFATTMTQRQQANARNMTAEVTITYNSGIATSYNVLKNEVTYHTTDPVQKSATYHAAPILGDECENDHVTYIRLASCYAIPPAGVDEKVSVHILVKEGNAVVGDLSKSDIPLTVNYSTNLYGKILTGSAGTTVATN